jgi:uncharacterized membrane protein
MFNGYAADEFLVARPQHDPMCVDETMMKWFMATLAGKKPDIDRVGLSYMLMGDVTVALLAASEKAWAATRASHQHGLSTFPDVREAERNLERARTVHQAARAEVLTRAAAFAFSTGDLARP